MSTRVLQWRWCIHRPRRKRDMIPCLRSLVTRRAHARCEVESRPPARQDGVACL